MKYFSYIMFKKNPQKGFTLIELMVTMVVFVLVIAASTSVFTGLLNQFKQQSKISEADIEKTVGLEILTQDLAGIGYGLPWNIEATIIGYAEATAGGGGGVPNPAGYNDAPNAPRAVVSSNGDGVNGSDYFVIKSQLVAENNVSRRWTWLRQLGVPANPTVWTGGTTSGWTIGADNLQPGDHVIILNPQQDGPYQNLVLNGGAFSTTFAGIAPFAPSGGDLYSSYIVYGVGPNPPRMPFNRADYFILNANVPARCADAGVSTGVLMKGIIANTAGGGNIAQFQPLVDCVADMQVVFRFDMDENGTVETTSSAVGAGMIVNGATAATVISTLGNPSLIRRMLKEVRIYILTHEGQRDPAYTYTPPLAPTFVPVGQLQIGGVPVQFGRNFNLAPIPNWENYRWKVYTLVVTPENLKDIK